MRARDNPHGPLGKGVVRGEAVTRGCYPIPKNNNKKTHICSNTVFLKKPRFIMPVILIPGLLPICLALRAHSRPVTSAGRIQAHLWKEAEPALHAPHLRGQTATCGATAPSRWRKRQHTCNAQILLSSPLFPGAGMVLRADRETCVLSMRTAWEALQSVFHCFLH